MKVIVYDAADFEAAVLNHLSQKEQLEIIQVRESLTKETVSLAEGCEGVSVLGYSRLNREVLTGLKNRNIKHISTRTIGYDHIDVNTAKSLGMTVSNARYSPNNVADFTVMMMLILLRKAKISICRALVNDFSLNGMMGREMRSMTVGIIGTGKIGFAVIQSLQGFGCRILCHDRVKKSEITDFAEYVELSWNPIIT